MDKRAALTDRGHDVAGFTDAEVDDLYQNQFGNDPPAKPKRGAVE